MPSGSASLRLRSLAGAAGLALLAFPGTAMASNYMVTISNMSYGRLPAKLAVGDTITWINQDSVPHTVTARDKSFDLRLSPGQKGVTSLAKAGKVPFYCIFHSPMRGTLDIAAK